MLQIGTKLFTTGFAWFILSKETRAPAIYISSHFNLVVGWWEGLRVEQKLVALEINFQHIKFKCFVLVTPFSEDHQKPPHKLA